MNNIIEVAQDASNIAGKQNIKCPKCKSIQYSVFDKLFTSAYGECVSCSPESEIEMRGGNIFAVIESM